MAAITYPAQAPLAFSPAGFTGALPVANFSPAAHCQDNAIVVLSTGTQAEGLFVLGGSFVTGDTITYNINGAGATVVAVSSLANALSAVVASSNTNTATTVVTAQRLFLRQLLRVKRSFLLRTPQVLAAMRSLW
jgi:hypothetical protein